MIIYIKAVKLTHSGSLWRLLLYQATPLYALWGGASLANSMSACPGTSSVSALPVHLLKPYLFVNRSSFLTPLLLLSWCDLHFLHPVISLSVQSLLGTLKQALFSFAGWWSGFFLLTHDIYIHEYVAMYLLWCSCFHGFTLWSTQPRIFALSSFVYLGSYETYVMVFNVSWAKCTG